MSDLDQRVVQVIADYRRLKMRERVFAGLGIGSVCLAMASILLVILQ